MLRWILTLVLSCTLLLVGEHLPASGKESVSFDIPATDDGLPGTGPIRRYDWFKNLWKRKRTEWATQIEQDQGAVVFLGDSITQGWGPTMGNAFVGMKVANRGISGDTTRGMLIRLQEDVLSLNPSAVVMLMGTNDLEELAKPPTIASNLKLIIAELKKHNAKMPIVLCNVFPSSTSKKRSAEDIREVNRLYGAAVKGDPQISVLDTWTLFANEQGDATVEEFPDLLHPNKLGYSKWAGALRPVFATLGLLEQDADDFQVEHGFTNLFNGYDLDGWGFRPSTEKDKRSAANWQKNDKNAPPWPIVTEAVNFDNKTSSTNGRYIAKNGRLVVTLPPEGRKIQQFYTQQNFPNDFVLKLEFRATPNADSGIFIRGKQLQCRDYVLAGPYKELKNYKPQDWNEVVISVRGQSAYCTCNGEVLEQDFKVPSTGPIGVEGDRGQVEYRRIRYKEIHSELPRATPEQQGVSSAAVLNFVEALEKIDTVHSFMLLRRGSVVAEGWWSPIQPNDPHQLYSLSKSFTSTAVGLAIDEGKLSLDDLVMAFFPDDVPKDPGYQLTAMRVRDLLTMSTGHVSDDLKNFDFQSDEVLTKQFLSLNVEHMPGTHFLYNTPATYMCSAIVQKATGEKIIDYLRPRLFEPLGIENPSWSESDQGICHGGFGLNIRTRDIAHFGQMLLQQGEWNGRQLVPAEWVELATARQVSNGSNPNNDWNQGYGFQFWRCRHNAYRGDGAFGQFCIVMPQQDAVLAVTSGASNMGAVMQQAWNHLLPGFHAETLRGDEASQSALKKKLGSLKLPLVEGQSSQNRVLSGKYVLEANNLGVHRFEFDNDRLTIHAKDQSPIKLPIGRESWKRSRVANIQPIVKRIPNADDVGIATHGAWISDNEFHLRMWLYESPFRIDMLCKFDGDQLKVDSKQNVNFGSKEFSLQGTAE